MDLLTRTDLEALADPSVEGAQVSLFLPTHRYGRDEIEGDRVRWKNLIAGVEESLGDQLRRPQIEELLAPARDLQQDVHSWQYMNDGLVMFLRQGWSRTYRIGASVPELATVGGRFTLGPLTRLLSGDERFWVLALSQREIRLMSGTRNTVDEFDLPDEMPTTLRDVVAPHDPRSDAMARPAGQAGRGGKAVFYGHGAGDRHLKKDEISKYLRGVAAGINELLTDQNEPMVLVGLDQMVAAYREVNSYANVLPEAVIHNPDGIVAQDLHEFAWPIIEEHLRADRAEVMDRFHELNGTGRVSADLETVAAAGKDGRVDTLFLRADPWCWERAAGGADTTTVVRLGGTSAFAECERVDEIAIDTLLSGGRIFATSQTVVPESEVAAIFRY